MPIKLTQPVQGKNAEETVKNIISALRQQQLEIEHYLTHLDGSAITSVDYKPVIGAATAWVDVATNFNTRNDRNNVVPSNPTIANDGTAIDHTLNTDGSANISFEWVFDGTGPGYDVDGFYVYVYASNLSTPYTFGTTLGLESINPVPAGIRAFIIEGVPADQHYTFGVQAYRGVDQDVDSDGELKSSIVKSTYAGENPYQPTNEVAFAGYIAGTLGNKPVSEVADFIETDYPADQIVVNGQIAQKKRVFLSTPTTPYDAGDLWCPGSTGEIMVCNTARTSIESYDPDDWESASDSVRLGTKYNLNSISTVDGFKSEDTDGNYTQMNAGGLKHHQKTTATLSGALTDIATSLTVSADVFPVAPFFIRIDNEIIRVNTKSGTSFTSISRGQAGTTATAHNSGAVVLHTKDYFYLNEIARVSTVGYGNRDVSHTTPYWTEAEVLAFIPPITIQLPDDFRGKHFKIFAEARTTHANIMAMRYYYEPNIYRFRNYALEVYDIDYVNATFKIKAYFWTRRMWTNTTSDGNLERCDGVDIAYTVTA